MDGGACYGEDEMVGEFEVKKVKIPVGVQLREHADERKLESHEKYHQKWQA